jgi:hypothetical protein
MNQKECRSDVPTQYLASLLEARYGVPAAKLDAGYQVSGLQDKPVREGAGDGCITFREAVAAAAEIATRDAFTICLSDETLTKTLFEDLGIRLPWLLYKESSGVALDHDRISAAAHRADLVRNEMDDAGLVPDSPAYTRELARRILFEFLPFDKFRTGETDACIGVWWYHAALLAAGIHSSFVMIPTDPLGMNVHEHVALAIDPGDGASIIVDPAYDAFDVAGVRTVELDLTQALSYAYYHSAMKAREPLAPLSLARALDPSNFTVKLAESAAKDEDARDFAMDRSSYWGSFWYARKVLSGEAAEPQSPSEAALGAVFESLRFK